MGDVDMTADFPRGGQKKGNRNDEENDANIDYEQLEIPIKKKIKTRVRHIDGVKYREVVDNSLVKKHKLACKIDDNLEVDIYSVQPLKRKFLTDGMTIMGCIEHINKYRLLISLPNGIRGTVVVANVSDPYTKLLNDYVDKPDAQDKADDVTSLVGLNDMFFVGMYVLCQVMGNVTNKNLDLTLNPVRVNAELMPLLFYEQMVLSAAVISTEEYGYTMDIGFSDIMGFLPYEAAKEYTFSLNQDRPLSIGQVIFCAIDMPTVEARRQNVRTIRLTADPDIVANALADEKTVTARGLTPGALVSLQVVKANSRGLELKGRLVQAVVWPGHFEEPFKLSAAHKAEGHVKGRVIYFHPVFRVPYVSLAPPLCSLYNRDMFGGLQPGNIIENVKVKYVIYNKVVLSLGNGVKGLSFLPVPDELATVVSPYPPGSKCRCIVKQLNYMDFQVIVSLKSGDLDKAIESVKVGDIVKATSCSMTKDTVIVKVGSNMKGVIWKNHLSDSGDKKKKRFHKHGKHLTCRVLDVSQKDSSLILTAKKSLVKSKLPIIVSYDDATPGLVTMGTVRQVFKKQLQVQFYSDVVGLITANDILGWKRSVSLEDVFHDGQVIMCAVISCVPESKSLKLSTNLSTATLASTTVAVGEVVSCQVVSVQGNGLTVEILPSGIRAFVPVMHLSDHHDNCKFLLLTYKKGHVIDEAVCFSFEKKSCALLSCKPLLVACTKKGTIFHSRSKVQVGDRVPVVVDHCEDRGLQVTMPYGIRAVCAINSLKNHFQGKIYKPGQTLIGLVTRIASVIYMCISPKHMALPDNEERLQFLSTYLSEQGSIKQHFRKRGDVVNAALASAEVGDIVDFTVSVKTPYKLMGTTAAGVKGCVVIENPKEPSSTEVEKSDKVPNSGLPSVEVGSTVKAMVLAVNFEMGHLDLSIETNLVHCELVQHTSLNVDEEYVALCLLVTNDFCLYAVLVKGKLTVAYSSTRIHPNESWISRQLPELGSKCVAKVKRVEQHFAIIISQDETIKKRMITTLKERLLARCSFYELVNQNGEEVSQNGEDESQDEEVSKEVQGEMKKRKKSDSKMKQSKRRKRGKEGISRNSEKVQ